jgi:hypothetical protein
MCTVAQPTAPARAVALMLSACQRFVMPAATVCNSNRIILCTGSGCCRWPAHKKSLIPQCCCILLVMGMNAAQERSQLLSSAKRHCIPRLTHVDPEPLQAAGCSRAPTFRSTERDAQKLRPMSLAAATRGQAWCGQCCRKCCRSQCLHLPGCKEVPLQCRCSAADPGTWLPCRQIACDTPCLRTFRDLEQLCENQQHCNCSQQALASTIVHRAIF